MGKKDAIEYGKENGYGKRTCVVCGSIFVAMKPAVITCSEKCLKERRHNIHKKSCAKRKDWIIKLIEERDNLLIENLELKKQLGIISQNVDDNNIEKVDESCAETADLACAENVANADLNKDEKAAIVETLATKSVCNGKYGSMKVERTCANCGKSFIPTGSKQQFCEKKCRRMFEYKVKKEKRAKENT